MRLLMSYLEDFSNFLVKEERENKMKLLRIWLPGLAKLLQRQKRTSKAENASLEKKNTTDCSIAISIESNTTGNTKGFRKGTCSARTGAPVIC